MNTSKVRRKITLKECSFIGCSNSFQGSQFEKYCKDPRCIEMRMLLRKKRTPKKDEDADNLILSNKTYGIKLGQNKVLNLRCRARNHLGLRCKETFVILFESNREVYPKYCKYHRTLHRRKMFERGFFNANY